jgi:hypothetical protein
VTIVHTALGIHFVHVDEPVLINANYNVAIQAIRKPTTTSTSESHLTVTPLFSRGISTAYDKSQKKAAGFNAASR